MDKPKISRILVPLDFSEITPRVLDYALLIAGQNRAELVLMHAVHVPPLAEASTWVEPLLSSTVEHDLRLQLKATAEKNLSELQARCVSEGVSATFAVCEGVPNSEIIRCAEEHQADLIVMGSQGHSAVSRFLIGSTAERVVRRSHLTVLCVKPEEEKGESKK
jgi:nucleotide-binding universal stress UspA family protein